MLRAIYAIIAGIVMLIAVIPIAFLVTGFNLGFDVAFGKSIHLLSNTIFQGPVIGLFIWFVLLIFRKANPYIISPLFLMIFLGPFFGFFTGHPLPLIPFILMTMEIILKGIVFVFIYKWLLNKKSFSFKLIDQEEKKNVA